MNAKTKQMIENILQKTSELETEVYKLAEQFVEIDLEERYALTNKGRACLRVAKAFEEFPDIKDLFIYGEDK